MNLAQAVLIALFMVRETWGGTQGKIENEMSDRRTKRQPTAFLEESLQVWLEEMGFTLYGKKVNAYTVLKRMLLQNTPTPKEIRILETVLQQSIRKLREWKTYQKK